MINFPSVPISQKGRRPRVLLDGVTLPPSAKFEGCRRMFSLMNNEVEGVCFKANLNLFQDPFEHSARGHVRVDAVELPGGLVCP
jgi:hypothetical protein